MIAHKLANLTSFNVVIILTGELLLLLLLLSKVDVAEVCGEVGLFLDPERGRIDVDDKDVDDGDGAK